MTALELHNEFMVIRDRLIELNAEWFNLADAGQLVYGFPFDAACPCEVSREIDTLRKAIILPKSSNPLIAHILATGFTC